MKNEVSNSIIGNNDGPTDIFVNTTNFLPAILTGIFIILVILGIIFSKKKTKGKALIETDFYKTKNFSQLLILLLDHSSEQIISEFYQTKSLLKILSQTGIL